eukprot:scaffold65663_cov69-Phaeocystis_antarctica.AAC.2
MGLSSVRVVESYGRSSSVALVIATTLSSSGRARPAREARGRRGTGSVSSAPRPSVSPTSGSLAIRAERSTLYSEMARSARERRRPSTRTPTHMPHAQSSEPRAMATMVGEVAHVRRAAAAAARAAQPTVPRLRLLGREGVVAVAQVEVARVHVARLVALPVAQPRRRAARRAALGALERRGAAAIESEDELPVALVVVPADELCGRLGGRAQDGHVQLEVAVGIRAAEEAGVGEGELHAVRRVARRVDECRLDRRPKPKAVAGSSCRARCRTQTSAGSLLPHHPRHVVSQLVGAPAVYVRRLRVHRAAEGQRDVPDVPARDGHGAAARRRCRDVDRVLPEAAHVEVDAGRRLEDTRGAVAVAAVPLARSDVAAQVALAVAQPVGRAGGGASRQRGVARGVTHAARMGCMGQDFPPLACAVVGKAAGLSGQAHRCEAPSRSVWSTAEVREPPGVCGGGGGGARRSSTGHAKLASRLTCRSQSPLSTQSLSTGEPPWPRTSSSLQNMSTVKLERRSPAASPASTLPEGAPPVVPGQKAPFDDVSRSPILGLAMSIGRTVGNTGTAGVCPWPRMRDTPKEWHDWTSSSCVSKSAA